MDFRLRSLWLSLVLALTSVPLTGQEPDTLGQAALLAVNAARFRAMVREDLSGLDTLLAPELTYIHSDGGLESKTEFLATLRTGRLRATRASIQANYTHASMATTWGL